jgi:hypothetical protein
MRQKLKKVFYRLFHSPTFTTWGNFLVKLGGWAFLLPLILHESPEEEVSIWMTFQTMIDFLLIFDLGLMQSFSRAFSYAFAGVRRLDVDKHGKLLPAEHGAVNWDLMGKIYGVSRRIYMFLAIAAVVLVLLYSAFVFYPELKDLESFDAYRYEMLWALLFLILGGGGTFVWKSLYQHAYRHQPYSFVKSLGNPLWLIRSAICHHYLSADS